MQQNKLFLQSLLQDSFLNESFIEKIQMHFDIHPTDHKEHLNKVEALVFFQNKRNANNGVASALECIATKQMGDYIYYPHHVLITSRAVFPKKEIVQDASLFDRYQEVVESLFIEGISIDNFSEKLFYLQKFYLSSIAAYGTPATVSQFEFLKSRASFAQCLALNNNNQYPFRLVCGDLSGIQSFIFDIHSSKAYKSLKGRSFYLQLVVETLIERILKDTNITPANVVYSSGGKFYLLLPNTEHCIDVLKKIEEHVQNELFKQFQLGLYVCLGSIGFNIDEYYAINSDETQMDGNTIAGMGDLWKTVSEKAALKKVSKYKSLLVPSFSTLFEVGLKEDYNGNGMTICAVSGVPVKEDKGNNIAERAEDPIYVHESVMQQTELGKKLQKNNVLIIGEKGFIEPLELGIYFDLTDKVKSGNAILLNPESEEIYLDFIKTYQSTRFLFYGGNQQVERNRQLASVEEIAEPAEDKKMNKIGIIKMDVDGLGNVFQTQKDEYNTLAAMSDLSARLDWFFSGYLNTLRNNNFKDTVNIIYSGGDDLCAVGRWDAVLDFASQVRSDFRKYIGDIDGVNISAGYSLFSPKFPISKAIAEAEDNLKEAKEFRRNLTDSKNAINLLGLSVNWQMKKENHREWEFVQDLQNLFKHWLKDGTMSKGTIYKLFVFKDSKDRGEFDWRWQSAYYFAKMKKPELNVLKDAIITDKFTTQTFSGHFPNRMFDLIILAAKLADYHSR